MALPRRKPNRLPNYDYSQAGYYFITVGGGVLEGLLYFQSRRG